MGSPMIDKEQLVGRFAGSYTDPVVYLRSLSVHVAQNGFIVYEDRNSNYPETQKQYVFTDPDDVAAHIAQVLEANAKAQV